MQLTFELSDLIALIDDPTDLKKQVFEFTSSAIYVSRDVQTLVIDKMNEIKESIFRKCLDEETLKRLKVHSFENYGQPGYF